MGIRGGARQAQLKHVMRVAFDRYWVAVAQVRRCWPTGTQRGVREPGRSPEFVFRYRIFGRSLIEIDTFQPRAHFSEGGYVYLAYRVGNRMTLPLCTEVNGGAVTELKPGIGHRHVAIGDGHMERDTCAGGRDYFGPLPAALHRVRIDLVDASHGMIGTRTKDFVLP
ncbi:DUF6130 family protein [Burkholderia gladioli]|uniref:DUF6130 family protein n=1 Tax=Burkholderia gladioli TaxID=28095 RepID=UPI00163F15B9|nr:DUF6130 family protein [Burkholderia gladioli]